MLTVFSIPKPFQGHIGVIQRNALASWSCLEPSCQIILFGDDAGVGDAAKEYGAEWVPDIKRNEYGTPLLNEAFREAAERAHFDLLCYVNADIILLDDLPQAIACIPFEHFLAAGRRWNIDHPEPLNVSEADWSRRLREQVIREGEQDSPRAIDYFVFHRDIQFTIHSFAVGRPGWDNWLLYRARQLRLPLIDVTDSTMVVHQNHDYRHVPQGTGDRWEGPEADANRNLFDFKYERFRLTHATHELKQGTLTHRPKSWRQWRDEQIALRRPMKWPLLVESTLRRWLLRRILWVASPARKALTRLIS